MEEGSGPKYIILVAPLHGRVVKIGFGPGDHLGKEDVIVVIETMKMENNVHAGMEAELTELNVEVGAQVAKGQQLCRIQKIK
ncbi:MAG: acetyl-CoA carboxylase biotin carboxyl carrier protein subunit [Bacteroidales bacterium]